MTALKANHPAGLVLALTLGVLAGASQAQTPAAPTAEVVLVTGSRIARHDADGVGPMLTLTRDDIAFAAPTSVGDLLQSLPNVGVSLNANGTQGTAFGASSINLRYLGSAEGSGNRTLVLVDGHRWINAAGGRGFRDFVDLNTIPLGMVDHIEVLKDGASAIYGADAIAGVVNIHTRRRLDGVETSVRLGQSSRGDGENINAYLNWGKRFERGAMLLSASFNDSKPILTSARDLTRSALAAPTAPPTITRTGGNAAIGVGAAADDSFHIARLPGDDYNTQVQGIYATGPSRRGALFGRASVDLGDDIKATAELLFNRRTSSQLFAPSPLDLRGSNGFSISKDQAYNPFGTANGVPLANALAFAGPTLRVQRVPLELGQRRNVQQVDTSRLLLGLEGSLADSRWDATYAYSRNRAGFDAINQVNFDNVYRALASPASCAGTAGCVPLNIFGTITPAMADYIRYNAHDDNGTSQSDLSINATRALLDLAGGPLSLATGYEYRKESAFDLPDPFAASNSTVLPALAGVPQAPTSAQSRDVTRGSYHLQEGYAELSAPLASGQPGMQLLEVDAALRYSHYSTVGGKFTGKLGLVYKPVNALMLRTTYAQGFRAPSILELYQGQRQTNFQAVDPCNGGGSGKVGCAGVPASYNQSQFNSGLMRGITAGNRTLKPDLSDSYSAGFAYTPDSLRGLSFTADQFRIKIRDAIASQSATQLLQACASSGVFCNLVVRAPSGEVLQLTQAVVNLSRIEVAGIDATLRYLFPLAGGKVDSALDLAYLQTYRASVPQPDGSVVVDDRAGKSDQPRSTFPRLKGQASVRYQSPAFDLGWKARYIGHSADLPNNAVNGGTVAAVLYHDLQLGTTFMGGKLRLALGIDNVFDRQPPASAANNPINFDIYTYDVRGRYAYVRLASKF